MKKWLRDDLRYYIQSLQPNSSHELKPQHDLGDKDKYVT